MKNYTELSFPLLPAAATTTIFSATTTTLPSPKSTIAEGVETAEQLSQLKSLRCDFGQGYLFSGPLDAEEAGVFIQSRQSFIPAALIEDGVIHAQLDLLN